MLAFDRLALRRGTCLLLEDLTLDIHPGWKVGVTGANGSGKSSLFSLILGEIGADAGEFSMPAGWRVAHVAQETAAGEGAAIEHVLDGDAELRRIERAIADCGADSGGAAGADGDALARLHADFEHAGGYTARARAGRLLHGLGFRPGDESRPVAAFSGGWRMRLNLAQALMCRSSLLLLDEPTNHLDLDALLWLEGWLAAYRGTLLLISHDREFLDGVVDRVLNLESGRATLHTGNYSAFERGRAEQLARERAARERQQREIVRIRAFVDRFRAKASKARQAQSRIKALERMEIIAPAHVDSPFRFSLPAPERAPNPLVRLDDAAAAYGGAPVIAGVRLTVAPGDRIGLLGRNGAGKSTFIRLLSGLLEPQAGERYAAEDLRTGYFAQHQLEQLDPDRSPIEHFAALEPDARESDLRNWLGGFGFSGDAVFMPVRPFSGGEKSRLALALLARRRPNLLLLDEPTNHLDLDMRQALAVALQDFPGAMVVVSHDRHLLRVATDRLLLVDEGRVTEFEGDLDDYRGWLAARRRDAAETASPSLPHGRQARREARREEAEERRRLSTVNRRIAGAEARLAELERERAALERELGEPELYRPENAGRLRDCLARQAANRRELAAAEALWLAAGEELERLQKQPAAD